jgi:CheY-like chemotaxis protein
MTEATDMPTHPADPDRFSVLDMLRRLDDTFRPQAEEKSLQLRFNTAAGLSDPILGKTAVIENVLANLIRHAIVSTREGYVTITGLYQNSRLTFNIADSSSGLSAEAFTTAASGSDEALVSVRDICRTEGWDFSIRAEKRLGTVIKLSLDAPRCRYQSPVPDPVNTMIEGWCRRWGAQPGLKTVFVKGLNYLREEIQTLRQAVDQNRRYELAGMLHSIKGFPGGFGLKEIYRPLLEMEAAVLHDPYDIDRVSACLVVLEETMAAIPADCFQQDELAANTAIASEVAKARASRFASLRILVAEDDDMNREMIDFVLKELGIECNMVSNGAEALEKLEAESFDLLLLDIQMQVMDGPTTLGRIRENDRFDRLPVIAISAEMSPATRKRLQQFGFTAMLEKPITVEAVSDLLDTLSITPDLPSSKVLS